MGWLDELQVSAGLSAPPLTSGTLVVFASGAARAGRVQEEDLFPAYRVWSWVGPPRVLSSARFEAGGEPLPLPRRIGVTAWRWLGFGTLAIILWAVRSLMVGAALGLPGDGPGAGRTTILALLAVRRFRRLLCSSAWPSSSGVGGLPRAWPPRGGPPRSDRPRLRCSVRQADGRIRWCQRDVVGPAREHPDRGAHAMLGVHRSPSHAVRLSSISANTRGPGASAHYSSFHGGRSGLGRGVSQKGLV
jgi:hypothetical protein